MPLITIGHTNNLWFMLIGLHLSLRVLLVGTSYDHGDARFHDSKNEITTRNRTVPMPTYGLPQNNDIQTQRSLDSVEFSSVTNIPFQVTGISYESLQELSKKARADTVKDVWIRQLMVCFKCSSASLFSQATLRLKRLCLGLSWYVIRTSATGCR